VFIQSSLYSQNDAKNTTEIDSIITYLKNKNELDSLALFTHDLSISYYKKKDFLNAIKYAKIEVGIGLKTQDSITYKNALFNLGLFYFRNKQFHNSINIYRKVVDSFSIDNKTHLAYCEIGRNYKKLGDFHQAIFYYEKGLEHPELLSTKNLSVNYRNLAATYDIDNTDINNYLEKKYDLLQKVDSLNKLRNPSENTLIRTYLGFGDYYANDDIFNFKKSKNYYNQALEKAIKTQDTSLIVTLYNKLGFTYKYNKNDSCVYYLNKSIKFAQSRHASLPRAYSNLAEYYATINNYELALKYSHKELSLTLPKQIDTSHLFVPSIKILSQSNNKIQALFSLKAKATYFLRENEETYNTKLALRHLELADQLLDIIRLESIENKSKLFWQLKASEIYMLAIKASFLLNDIDNAFYFMEKRKAILLLENLSESELRQNVKIDLESLEKESNLKQKIFHLENQLNDPYYTNKDSLENIHYNYKIKYLKFITSLKQKYPEYYDYKIKAEIFSLEELKEKLDNETVIIEYVLDKNDGYVMYINQENSELYRISDITDLHSKIKLFNKCISKPFSTTQDQNSFNKLSNEVYKSLIPKSTSDLFNKKNKLIIIPDYILQTIPFEALQLTLNTKDYLIKKYEISYSYSISFLNKNNETSRNAKNNLIGFAPYSFSYDQKLNPLERSKEELESIESTINGNFFHDSSSTKENFISNINNYKIIHLATHANSNDSITPWIAFKNEKLLLNELYTIKNQAELVILSACNTAIGEIKEGEGAFSLARGFFYSGSNSVISSLWQVNDKSTSFIMQDFYKNIKNNNSKSNALRKAKINYLDSQSLTESSPYYWASFVLIGNADSIEFDNNFSSFYFIISIVFILIILFLFRKRKKNIFLG
tara:strand:- start:8616 stop:11267 length:2652 start_codon:yes stop_codon:yes gene_type:complete